MSKPSYTGAKTYFLVLEIIAFVVFVVGCIVSISLYQTMGRAPAISAAAGSFLTFLAIVAISQIGRATIHTAENTRRMADLMETDRKARGNTGGSRPRLTSDDGAHTDQLVARR